MKIGIDARLWNETGVGRYIRSLFKHLSYLDKENEYVWFFRKKEFTEINLLNPKWRKVKADIHWHTLSEQLFLPWIFYKEKLDLLHFPYFSFPIFYPGKFVITIHDLIFDHYKTGKASTLPAWFYLIKRTGYQVVLWSAVRRAKAVFTLSSDAKSEIIDHYKVNPGKIVVTYESGAIEDARKNFTGAKFKDIRKLQPYLLYIGNVHPHKNVESLVLAMKEIGKIRKDLKLVLVGSDRFFYPRLERFIKREGRQNQVVMIGAVDNTQIAAWYHFAEALVTASKMEGFGIPPLEAMSLGCPVIVSDIPIFHEVYGDAAIYFDQNDPSQMAKVILSSLADKRLLEEQIKKGYKRALMYSWQKMAEETLEVYVRSACL